MNIIELDQGNIDNFREYFGNDILDNIGRAYYCGLIAVEEFEIKAGMVWRYTNQDNDLISIIEWFETADKASADEILSAYTEKVKDVAVKKSKIVVRATKTKEEKDILKDAGFTVKLTESDKVIVTLSELSAMPLMKDRKIPRGVTNIGEVTVRQFKECVNKCQLLDKRGVCDDISFLSVSFFEQDVSTCFVDANEDVTGLLLFHLLPSGMLSIQLMICLDKNIGAVLPGMMKKFVELMEENYPPDTKILLNRHNEASLLLSEKLLPRGFGIPVYAGSRDE